MDFLATASDPRPPSLLSRLPRRTNYDIATTKALCIPIMPPHPTDTPLRLRRRLLPIRSRTLIDPVIPASAPVQDLPSVYRRVGLAARAQTHPLGLPPSIPRGDLRSLSLADTAIRRCQPFEVAGNLPAPRLPNVCGPTKRDRGRMGRSLRSRPLLHRLFGTNWKI